MKSRILVFARAPVPGRCKTRLIPALGTIGAARLHRRLVLRTVAAAHATGVAVELWCTPDARHPLFQACRRNFGSRLRRQPPGDLGRKMAWALTRVLYEGAETVVLVGTDCPSLHASDLNQALSRLKQGSDCVLQGSTDGGYVLIGARRIPRRALAGIAWSSGHEGAQTRRRLRRFNLTCAELEPRTDVDTPADYRRLRRRGVL